MKPLLLFLTFAAVMLTIADEKYLLFRQPTDSTQVGEPVTVPPGGFFIGDATGKIKPRVPVPSDIAGVFGQGTVVATFAQLQAASVNAAVKRIILMADINVTASLQFPVTQTVVFNGYKLKETVASTILFYGVIDAGREQIFENWEEDDIRGNLNGIAYPEWFGLVGSNLNDGEHDLAINRAISMNIDGTNSINVLVGSRVYWVKRPCDLRGTKSRIIGQASSNSQIWATTTFDPGTWEGSWVFANALPNMSSAFSAVTTESAGAKIRLTTAAGGCTEYYAGGTAKITGSSVAGYNGNHVVDSVVDHQTVILNKAFSANATGTVTPVTLDSVMETGANSCSSVVWMGSDDPGGGRSFFTGVEKVAVNAYYASARWPLKRIHAIAWTGWVEEHSFIRDVNLAGFSGFGIGGESPAGVTTVNGMTVSNFHIAGGTRRGAIGIYAPQHANSLAFREGTVNLGVIQEQTRDKIGGPPAYVMEWAQFGCLAAGGHTVFDGVHVEGVGNAFHAFATGGGSSVEVINCDHNNLMDWGMVHFGDTAHQPLGKPDLAVQMATDNLGGRQTFLYHHSCGVSIGRLPVESEAANNYDSNVVVSNYRNSGSGVYLLRDWIYNVDMDGFGGRTPNAQTKSLNFYTRGIPYGLAPETVISAAASHTAGAKTLLTVTSSTGFIAGNTVYIAQRSADDAEYAASTFVVDSAPSGTEIVINKAWTDTLTGNIWKQGAYYDRNSPPTDKTYFIGPVW